MNNRRLLPVVLLFILILAVLTVMGCGRVSPDGSPAVPPNTSDQQTAGQEFVKKILDSLQGSSGWTPPLPPSGGQKPRILTKEEKDKVLEIAGKVPQVVDTKQNNEVVSVDTQYLWVGWIGHSDRESFLGYGSVENGTANLTDKDGTWYPATDFLFHSRFGEYGKVGIQVAVNLGTGKVVWLGGYSSFPIPPKTPSSPSTPGQLSQISRQQAIEIAGKMLRDSITSRAKIRADLHGWYWEVIFDDLNARADELMPWPLKGPPPPPPGQPTPEPYPGVWQTVIATVDAQTGDLHSMGARQAPKSGPYVDQEQATKSAKESILKIPTDISWIERASIEAYLQGDTWIVIFWEEGSTDHRFSIMVDAVTGIATGASRG